MTVFTSTLRQMAFLFLLIAIPGVFGRDTTVGAGFSYSFFFRRKNRRAMADPFQGIRG